MQALVGDSDIKQPNTLRWCSSCVQIGTCKRAGAELGAVADIVPQRLLKRLPVSVVAEEVHRLSERQCIIMLMLCPSCRVHGGARNALSLAQRDMHLVWCSPQDVDACTASQHSSATFSGQCLTMWCHCRRAGSAHGGACSRTVPPPEAQRALVPHNVPGNMKAAAAAAVQNHVHLDLRPQSNFSFARPCRKRGSTAQQNIESYLAHSEPCPPAQAARSKCE